MTTNAYASFQPVTFSQGIVLTRAVQRGKLTVSTAVQGNRDLARRLEKKGYLAIVRTAGGLQEFVPTAQGHAWVKRHLELYERAQNAVCRTCDKTRSEHQNERLYDYFPCTKRRVFTVYR